MKKIPGLLVTMVLLCIGLLLLSLPAQGQQRPKRDGKQNASMSITDKCLAPTMELTIEKRPLSYLPQVPNPIDDTRFFVRQHYHDFVMRDPPDNPGWDFWSNQITACGTNAVCIANKRVDVSRAFFFDDNFVALQFPINPGLSSPRGTSTYNQAFVRQCYLTYMRREPNAPPDNNFNGFNFWLGVLNSYGSPTPDAGYNHLIKAFLESTEYRARFVSTPC